MEVAVHLLYVSPQCQAERIGFFRVPIRMQVLGLSKPQGITWIPRTTDIKILTYKCLMYTV